MPHKPYKKHKIVTNTLHTHSPHNNKASHDPQANPHLKTVSSQAQAAQI